MNNQPTCPIGVNRGRDSDQECGKPTTHYRVIGSDSDAELVRVCDDHANGRPAPLWVREHGAEYDVPAAIYMTLDDQSWHNDACPSFGQRWPLVEGSDAEVILWVEHPDTDQRETGSAARFCVQYRGDDVDEADTLLETDDVDEALARYHEAVKNVEASL